LMGCVSAYVCFFNTEEVFLLCAILLCGILEGSVSKRVANVLLMRS
jgi:hypothetical protein